VEGEVVLSKGAGAGALTAGAATGVVVVLVCGDEPAESEPPPPPQATRITAQEARRTERIVDSGVILRTSIKSEKEGFRSGIESGSKEIAARSPGVSVPIAVRFAMTRTTPSIGGPSRWMGCPCKGLVVKQRLMRAWLRR